MITERHIESTLGRQLSELKQQIYKLKRQKVDELINAELLDEEAKRAGVSVATLLESQVDGKTSPVSEEEIRVFYDRNKDSSRVEFDKVHDQIRDYLREQKIAERKNEFFKTLRAKANVTTYLKPPPVQRADVSFNGAPVGVRRRRKSPS